MSRFQDFKTQVMKSGGSDIPMAALKKIANHLLIYLKLQAIDCHDSLGNK